MLPLLSSLNASRNRCQHPDPQTKISHSHIGTYPNTHQLLCKMLPTKNLPCSCFPTINSPGGGCENASRNSSQRQKCAMKISHVDSRCVAESGTQERGGQTGAGLAKLDMKSSFWEIPYCSLPISLPHFQMPGMSCGAAGTETKCHLPLNWQLHFNQATNNTKETSQDCLFFPLPPAIYSRTWGEVSVWGGDKSWGSRSLTRDPSPHHFDCSSA